MRITGKDTLAMIAMVVLIGLSGEAGARAMYRAAKKHAKERRRASGTAPDGFTESTFRTVLSRLKKQGLVENKSWGIWRITTAGKQHIDATRRGKKEYEDFLKNHAKKRDTIIIFDVPEARRKLRDYLRAELIALEYKQLQKSVWIGGGPLPEEFLKYVKKVGLMDSVHIFSIRERGTVE